MAIAFLKNRLIRLMTFKGKQFLVALGVILILIALTGISITNYLTNKVRQDLVKEGEETLQSASVYLASRINELDTNDDILAGLPWVATVLESQTPQKVDQINAKLLHYNKAQGTTVCFLLDRNGTALASSNANDTDSLIGNNYRTSKYFNQAMRGLTATDFTIEPTAKNKGLYVSSAVRDHFNRVIGVAVVKKDLDLTETPLNKYPNSFLVNHCGTILWSSATHLAVKSLWPMERSVDQNTLKTNETVNGTASSLFSQELKNGMEIKFEGDVYRVNRELIGKDGWSIVFLTNMAKVNAFRIGGYLFTAAAVWILLMAAIIIHSRKLFSKKVARLAYQVTTLVK